MHIASIGIDLGKTTFHCKTRSLVVQFGVPGASTAKHFEATPL
jgi:hypothetical protein